MSEAPAVEPFGTLPDGRHVEQWTLRNAGGRMLRFITYGQARPCLGALTGRFAYRIARMRLTRARPAATAFPGGSRRPRATY